MKAPDPTDAHRALVTLTRQAATRRQRTLIGAALAAVVAASALTGVAFWQRGIAVENQQRADKTRDEALLSESKHLVNQARQVLEQEKDTGTALLVALEALPDTASGNETTRTRPYWAPAEVSLEAARRLLREKAVLIGHAEAVTSVAMSPDGSRIVTGSFDDTAKVWDARTFAELATLKGHGNSVYSVAVSPDGSRIVTGSGDNTAKVWDARTFAELVTLKGHGDQVTSVAVSADGSRIVTGSGDGTAQVWDAATFAELAALMGHDGNVYSVAASADGSLIVSGSDNKTAKVWELFPAGQALVADAQRVAARCLTPAQRERFHLAPAPPTWCVERRLWPYHTDDWQAWLPKRKAWLATRDGPAPALPKDATK